MSNKSTAETAQSTSNDHPATITVEGPQALRRFLKHLSSFESALQAVTLPRESSGPERFRAHALYLKNGRAPVFSLQGLARVSDKLYEDEKLFSRIKLESKIVEDMLGGVDFWWVTAKKSKEWGFPASVTELAEDNHIEACGKAWAWIEAQHWVSHRYQEEEDTETTAFALARKLRKVDWMSPKKEAKALIAWLTEELTESHEKILALDFQDIEHGLHEARRQIRWFSIYAGALEGAIVLDTSAETPDNWEKYMQKNVVENPFNKLATPGPKDKPIAIAAPLFYALSYVIDRLGAIKDRAQWTETMAHLVAQSGEKLNKPLAEMMPNVYIEHEEASRLAKELVAEVVEKDQILLKIANSLDRAPESNGENS